MEKKVEQTKEKRTGLQQDGKKETTPKKKVSKAWEAAQRLKSSVVINDPTLFWR